MPTTGTHVRRAAAAILGLCLLIYGAGALRSFFDDTDCALHNYDAKLGGGAKTIQGRKYVVTLCGNGGGRSHLFGDTLERVRLSIADEQGRLLARRYYSVFWDAQPGHNPIEVEQDRIVYYDDDDKSDSRRTIRMPPSMIDWLRARAL